MRVGDRVRLTFGSHEVFADVIEDRGNLGVRGRQILRILPVNSPSGMDDAFEIPAEQVTKVD